MIITGMFQDMSTPDRLDAICFCVGVYPMVRVAFDVMVGKKNLHTADRSATIDHG